MSQVRALTDEGSVLSEVGGKGQALSRLARAGFPVPPGFHVTTSAYVDFVERYGLAGGLASLTRLAEDAVGQSATELGATELAAVETAATAVRARFTSSQLPDDLATSITTAYCDLGSPPVAVRSSATAEDLPEASFAGQQDSYLNVSGADQVLDAIRRCWASLWTTRAVLYRARPPSSTSLGVEPQLAVVVQELVPAEAAGVLFTADPVTGSTQLVQVNAAWGLGESVVGGLVTPDAYAVDRTSGRVTSAQVNAKTTMTVPVASGTTEVAVPGARVSQPALTDDQVGRLARLGLDIERLFGHPVDVEWCRSGDQLFVVQARPITTGADRDPWNDSRGGDYLWTSNNVGEAVPDVMTPATWSLVGTFLNDSIATLAVPPYVGYGRVGGRLYLNLTLAASIGATLGISQKRFLHLTADVFGRLPADVTLPYVRLPRRWVLRRVIPVAVRISVQAARGARRLPEDLRTHPARCAELRAQIEGVDDARALSRLWRDTLEPGFHVANNLLNTATRSRGARSLITVRKLLQKRVGDRDTEALLAGLGAESGQLASLGLLVGLDRVRTGEIDTETFNLTYGHRGPHEFEVSTPRPGEQPGWVDAQLREMGSGVTASELLLRQEARRAEAWSRFAARYPRRVRSTSAGITRWATVSRQREAARSEVIRYFWVLRAFLLRAGELTGTDDDIFCYDLDEVIALLEGRAHPDSAVVADRRRIRDRYAGLPAYPTFIRGAFDPFRWASDPGRRTDAFLPAGSAPSPSGGVDPTVLTGFPGSEGVVEATARVIVDVADGSELLPGEVLVTSVTNVGWTPLFPRAAAVVTDVGAPLSHAAIVARELGIPAVVGCGDATSRIATGDRVLVDGSAGTVRLLSLTG